jgi:restriction system protein
MVSPAAASSNLGFIGAARRVLESAGVPMHTNAITEKALKAGFLVTSGRTPEDSMSSRLAMEIKQKGTASEFVRTAPGIFGLARWVKEGTVKPMPLPAVHDVRVPDYPTYRQVRAALPVFAGRDRDEITGMTRQLAEQGAEASETLDWSDPESWIPERLDGQERELAQALWRKTKGAVNPRYVAGIWLLASGYGLLADDAHERLQLTSDGREFIEHLNGAVERRLDESEGVARLLALIAEHGPATTADLLPPWKEHLSRVSRIKSDISARASMGDRLRNLVDRTLVDRNGRTYSVTATGLAWLKQVGPQAQAAVGGDEDQRLWELIADQQEAVRAQMRTALSEMNPYAFERLVGQLLEEMGYTDVEVTAPSNDKGVDVVAAIELGISSVREVVQVKRQRANIHRPVLDMLRGSLHRFKAVRGTLISTGDFAKGTRDAAFEVGAAPITLINGEKLVDLLVENGIGVRKKEVVVLEFDGDAFVADPGAADAVEVEE